MKYKYFIYGDENRHNLPHVHIRLSDGRKLVLSLPDLKIITTNHKFKTHEINKIVKDLKPNVPQLLKDYYEKNK